MNGMTNIGQPTTMPYPPAKPVAEKEPASKAISSSAVAAPEQKLEGQSPKPATERDFDRYVPEEPPVSAGAYHPATDEDGTRRIVFDTPAPESDSPKPASDDKAAPESDKRAASSCTVNTDKVEAEIRSLKKKQAKLEQQLAQADDRQRDNLERQLAQVEAELRLKDTDAYRKQHAIVTENP